MILCVCVSEKTKTEGRAKTDTSGNFDVFFPTICLLWMLQSNANTLLMQGLSHMVVYMCVSVCVCVSWAFPARQSLFNFYSFLFCRLWRGNAGLFVPSPFTQTGNWTSGWISVSGAVMKYNWLTVLNVHIQQTFTFCSSTQCSPVLLVQHQCLYLCTDT